MTSLQQGAGSNKSAKFVAANPLDPMLRPFENNDGEKDVQQQLADNVNERLEKAIAELQERHRNGTAQVDDPDRAPTGPAYQAVRQQQQALQRQAAAQKAASSQAAQQEAARLATLRQQVAAQLDKDDNNGSDDSDNDDDDYDDLLDDPALDEIRDLRLQQMKQAHEQKLQDLARGHGQVRTISQDEFLPECTGSSPYVAVHFFHAEFQRCDIMDFHLKQIAVQHTECKCLRINAEKAPFFVQKLHIRTLPTLMVFCDGKAVDRLTGFEGLSRDPVNKPDEWSTRRLKEWMAQTGAIQYTPSAEDIRQDMEEMGIQPQTKKTVYSSSRAYVAEDDD